MTPRLCHFYDMIGYCGRGVIFGNPAIPPSLATKRSAIRPLSLLIDIDVPIYCSLSEDF
jgi:hypothetical protein